MSFLFYRINFFLIFLIFTPCFSFSQNSKKTKKADEIKILYTFLSAGEIKESGNLRGYYEFLAVDKEFNNMQNYEIGLRDENFTKIKEIKFKEKPEYRLSTVAYSNEELCFMFIDNKNKAFEYRVYDMEGNLISEISTPLTKKEYNKLLKFGTVNQLINIEGGGFVSTSSISEKNKMTFKVIKLAKGSKNIQSYQFIPQKKFNKPKILGLSNGTIVLSVNSSKTLYSKPYFSLVGLNVNTMKQTFLKTSENDGEYQFKPYSLVDNPEYSTIKVCGSYYGIGENTIKGSTGLALWEIDTMGVLLKEKYNPWYTNFSSFMEFKKNGKAKKFGYVRVHETFSTSDGKIYAIGEGYRKRLNGWGLFFTALSWPVFLTKYQTTDIALFEFDNQFNFIQGKKIPKALESLAWYGFTTTNVHRLSNYIPMFGYNYVQLSEDRKNFMIAFTEDNFSMFRVKKSKYSFNTCKFENGKYTFDKFLQENNHTFGSYMRHQFGKIVYYNYSSKDKESNFRIIKVK